MNKLSSNSKIAVIGLGYVGLPLAVEFSKKYNVIGFDINAMRIQELQSGIDKTLELETSELKKASNLKYTSDLNKISDCTIFIIGVPTPVDENNKPDFTSLISASKNIGKVLKKNDVVIFESTVYPGATEEICVPELAKNSNLTFNKDFYVGYSPERINPGDKSHRLTDIIKVTSGSTQEAASLVDDLYSSIITAGTYKASSIKVAEAAKVIENTQRDVNIGLINELATIFEKLSLDTEEVLNAAGTKWNFLPFKPGLVGGHCIGVDPYYLSYKAQAVGYEPELILAGRKINDGMSKYISNQINNIMKSKDIDINNSNILVMGITFKEDCPDTRNTKVFDLIKELTYKGASVKTYDPWVNKDDLPEVYRSNHIEDISTNEYDSIVFAVAHSSFKEMSPKKIRSFCKENHIIYDLKCIFPSNVTDARL
jgi:UDP-N-acetyl-D-galactosamine dehydrogenase